MSHIAIILSGCGFQDGSEIHESTLCMLALAQAGHTYHCFAPDLPQPQVINHLTNEPVDEQRNALVESARIARGAIASLPTLDPDQFDAILLPGGFGAASTLCTFGTDGDKCTVNPDLAHILHCFHQAQKPIAATCIAPAILAKLFPGATLTLGTSNANQSLTAMGANAIPADTTSVVSDDDNLIYTTPCYMNPPNLPAMFQGITKLISFL